MGCGGSKEKEKPEIDCDFPDTGVAKVDEFFKPVKNTCEAAEKLRKGLIGDKEEALEITEAWKVKDLAARMETAFKVYFNCLSASHKGKASEGAKLEFGAEPPFAKFKTDGDAHPDTNKLADALNGYLEAVANGPKEIVNISKEVQDAVTKSSELASSDMSGLSGKEKMMAPAKIAKNCNKLKKNAAKIKALQDAIPAAGTEMKTVGPNLKKYYDDADTIGAKAAEANKKEPKQIFAEFYKDGLMTEAEQKEYQDEKEGKGKKDKKDKKK